MWSSDGSRIVYAILYASLPCIVGGQSKLGQFRLIFGIMREHPLEEFQIFHSGAYILLRVKQIVSLEPVRRARHHLHEAYRSPTGMGLDTEL